MRNLNEHPAHPALAIVSPLVDGNLIHVSLTSMTDEALELSEESVATSTEQGLGRRNSANNRSSSSLTRRRSLLLTPGVATRIAPVEGRRRTWNSWKAPKLDPKEEAKWKPKLKGAQPSNRLTALDLAEENRDSPTPRAQTPGEMDYSHLGNLRLGTLVVTNGAASPAPSSISIVPKHGARHSEEGDYFSAAEASSSPLMMKTTRRPAHAKSKLPDSLTIGPPSNDSGIADNERGDAKLDQLQRDSSSNGRPSGARPEKEHAKDLHVTTKGADMLRHNASQLAQSYQAYIPLSPFRASTESFNDGNDHPPRSGGTASKEAVYELDGANFVQPIHELESTCLGLSSPVQQCAAPERQSANPSQRPPPRTADSGYSSGGSLRVANREQPKDSKPAKSTARSGSPLKRDSAIREQSDGVVPLVGSELPSPTIAHAKQLNQRPSSLKIHDLSARSSARSSTTETIFSPQTPRSVASNSSFDSASSAAQKRLQKKRQSQLEHPVVQSCQPILESNIPDVPDNVRANFSRRLSHTPGMEYLTHTYPTTDHVLADKSVSDAPSAVVRTSQVTKLEPERPPTPPAHGRRRNLSLFRRRSTVENTEVGKEEENAPVEFLDLGTIASALGQSPYDAAMSGPLKKSVTSPTHPHQLGNRMPRAKSMVCMDSEFAAEFARMRSKDRALAGRDLRTQRTPEKFAIATQVAPTASSPPGQQRRRSCHNLKLEAGEAKAWKRRPKSFYEDMPPVPSINMSKVSILHTSKARMEGDGHKKTVSVASINPRMKSPPPEDVAAWGRYSGGLAYNYEGRGVGVGGSAGTRQLHSVATNKSLHWRNQYGVDLSDVPVMLQRV